MSGTMIPRLFNNKSIGVIMYSTLSHNPTSSSWQKSTECMHEDMVVKIAECMHEGVFVKTRMHTHVLST